MGAKVSLKLLLSPDLNRELDQIAASAGVTKSDVVRQALALMKVTYQAKRQGRHIGIVSDAGKLDTEFVGLL